MNQNIRQHVFVYPPETAGRIMTINAPTINENASLADIEQLLIKKAADFDAVNYVYLVDPEKKLKGVVSIKELFRALKTKFAKEFSPKNLITVRPSTDQERVALLALKHNIKAVPVVDKDDKFLGVVISDTILNILHSESIEDALRFAGAGKLENPSLSIIKAPSLLHFYKRFPWLVFGLVGGIVAAFVVDFFEEAIKTQLALAAFIPTIVYMADAVGAQTQTIFVRSLALERALNLKKYIWREIIVNSLLAILLGVIIAIFSFFWLRSGALSAVLGVSVFATVLAAMAIAISLPWLFQKFKYDPVIASGPFATVIRDIISLLIYFGIALLLL